MAIVGIHCLSQGSQCCSLVMHRMFFISEPYLGACCYELSTYINVKPYSDSGIKDSSPRVWWGLFLSPSLYWKNPEFLLWFSERIRFSRSLDFVFWHLCFLWTRRLPCFSGGSHLEVKKKSPLKELVRNKVHVLMSFILLSVGVGDVFF